ncbi:hypothetical protein BJ878DRAFT_522772 [Calycina marina]|uniref:Uncharacterized protein n=1 Tax=Calycina marina TaxID=1763456 RepID=A0A9P7YWD0_9HELO|nr:hypothetical protein BJ878DRAFT_522772 [Calycina marina]
MMFGRLTQKHGKNYLREALDLEYYTHVESALRVPEVAGEVSHRIHLDHCIELLRQSLMCHLDLTPIPRLRLPNSNLQHANQDQVHTCRDFSSIRNWVVENSIVLEN